MFHWIHEMFWQTEHVHCTKKMVFFLQISSVFGVPTTHVFSTFRIPVQSYLIRKLFCSHRNMFFCSHFRSTGVLISRDPRRFKSGVWRDSHRREVRCIWDCVYLAVLAGTHNRHNLASSQPCLLCIWLCLPQSGNLSCGKYGSHERGTRSPTVIGRLLLLLTSPVI